ncbi:hypothetical protein [Cesiribacter sp. SM1]|uniref:hypothetical protein n=1 Tax=Cesiribacter sp. SM1 TaxID=2861196 RepID=UPI001CD4699E|nr:hypothetical protein [Cesiribacter sp. SM1]
MINFTFHKPRTIRSLFQMSFSRVEELHEADLPLGEDSYIMIAFKSDMTMEELNHITDNFDERFSEREVVFEMFESIDHNILYIFN